MIRTSRKLGGVAAIVSFLIALVVSLGASNASGTRHEASTEKVILFASDGMRPDLMEEYARQGSMPTYRALMHAGVRGHNGLMQGFPPNTGVGWATLATGAWPGEHGSTNNTFHRLTDPSFNNSTSFAATGLLQADTIGQAAERAGKDVASVEWVAARGYVPALQGPVVDFRSFFSRRGILLNYDIPGQPDRRERVRRRLLPGRPRRRQPAGRTCRRLSARRKQERLTVTTTFAAVNPTRLYDLYIYDSTNDGTMNYDHVLVVPALDARTARGRRRPEPGRVGRRQGDADRRARRPDRGLLRKAIDIAPRPVAGSGSTSRRSRRVNATYNALGPAGSAAFEETLAHDFPTSTAADFAPLEARHRRRGHVRRAGAQVEGRALRVPPLHLRRRSASSPTCCCSAPRPPTSSSTSSWGSSRRRTSTAIATRTSTTSRTTTSRTDASRTARATSARRTTRRTRRSHWAAS